MNMYTLGGRIHMLVRICTNSRESVAPRLSQLPGQCVVAMDIVETDMVTMDIVGTAMVAKDIVEAALVAMDMHSGNSYGGYRHSGNIYGSYCTY